MKLYFTNAILNAIMKFSQKIRRNKRQTMYIPCRNPMNMGFTMTLTLFAIQMKMRCVHQITFRNIQKRVRHSRLLSASKQKTTQNDDTLTESWTESCGRIKMQLHNIKYL